MSSSAETATFAIALDDQTSGPARQAAGALQELKAKIDGDTAALREMQTAMRRLKAATSPNVAVMRELRDRIDASKASIAAAQAKYIQLGGTFAGVTRRAENLSDRGMDKLLRASKQLPGPLGGVFRALDDVGDLVAGGGLIAAGSLAAAAALVVLVAGLATASVALARYAVSQADARRNELLRIQALGGGANAAADVQRSIDRIAESTAMPRAGVERLAASLYRAGRRGADLEAALRRVTIRRLGGADVAARRLLSLDVQAEKLKESIGALFSGLPIEGFLRGVREVLQLFSQSTATGRALKAIAEAIFGPMIGDVGVLAPLVKRFFQGLVIGALQVTIAVLRVRNWFRDTFGDTQLLGGIDTLTLALNAGRFAVDWLVAGVQALAVVLGALALVFAAVAVSALLMAAVFLLPVIAVGLLVYGVAKLFEYLQGLDWGGAADAIINGLVGGIEAGIGRVRSAITNLAAAARGALTDALGIASPSRVFAELGRQIPRGLAVGVEADAPVAQAAVDDMAPAPTGGGLSSSTVSVSIGDVHIHGAGGDARELAGSFRDELATALEQLGIGLGSAGGEQPA